MARPRIGINLDLEPRMRTLGDGRLFTLNPDYVRGVVESGGIPIVLPAPPSSVSDIRSIVAAQLESIDGLILIGGNDMDPGAYGQQAHPRLELLDPERDRYDLELARTALTRGLPILGICGGMQLLNVVFGGSLHQHLPDLPQSAGRALEPVHLDQHGAVTSHEVRVSTPSLLARLLGTERLRTNSRHHQAVDRVGAGLRVSGRSIDGVIEAIESEAAATSADPRSFVLGLQWHPEEMFEDSAQMRIFAGFIAAAQRCSEPKGTCSVSTAHAEPAAHSTSTPT